MVHFVPLIIASDISVFARRAYGLLRLYPGLAAACQWGETAIAELQRIAHHIDQPHYHHRQENRTVSLTAEFRGDDSTARNHVEVILSFKVPWWNNNKVFLIDDSGKVLASTSVQPNAQPAQPVPDFGTRTPLNATPWRQLPASPTERYSGQAVHPRNLRLLIVLVWM